MKEVTMFEASDGKLFEKSFECEDYENNILVVT